MCEKQAVNLAISLYNTNHSSLSITYLLEILLECLGLMNQCVVNHRRHLKRLHHIFFIMCILQKKMVVY